MEWRETDGVRRLEAELPGARAAFSTRLGGVSEAPFDSLNLGVLTDDDPEAVEENRRRLAAALGHAPGRIAFGLQVHGAELATHADPPRSSFVSDSGTKEDRDADPLKVDGHVLSEPGLAALVFVADCLPVALVGPGGAVMLHCGWRGLAAGIIARGVEAIGATAAAIGPGIGPCCFEVGDEVLTAFADLGDGLVTDRSVTRPEGIAVSGSGRHLDLPEVARRLLARAGVEQIESAGLCTSCESELFFSHRRDAGRTGRQAGLVWLEGKV
ncbi:MAG TPA: polyphenol oxidase family protein [Solirubrobacterales bacterium]|nr:polyphenol oxidase family protein [Solirubrobacterales bacterium]